MTDELIAPRVAELFGDRALADRTRDRLQLVIDASIAFSSTPDESEVARELADFAARAYRAEDAVVYLVGANGELRLAAGTNPFAEHLREPVVRDLAFGRGGVLKVSGMTEAAFLPGLRPAFQATGLQAVLLAPLRHLGEELGFFACFFSHPRQFDDEAEPLALALGGQAAQAIANLRMRRTLEHAALHDAITGLPNRRHLEEHAAAIAAAGSETVAVLFIDLDRFKEVNDRLGHPVGDRVLREVGRRLQGVVREHDLVARYGGDEFVVLCEVAGAEDAARISERLRAAVAEPYEFLPTDLGIGASVGMSLGATRDPALSVDRLIRMADQAMYSAKNAGGDRVVTQAS